MLRCPLRTGILTQDKEPMKTIKNPPKRKKLSAEDIWNIIEKDLKWGTCLSYVKISRKLYAEYTEKQRTSIHNFVDDRFDDLYTAFIKSGHLIVGNDGLSDDGLSDVLAHIVGLGNKEFLKSIENPKLIGKRYKDKDYTESFLYSFLEPETLGNDDEKELEPTNESDWHKISLEEVTVTTYSILAKSKEAAIEIVKANTLYFVKDKTKITKSLKFI